MKTLDEILKQAQERPNKTVAIACPEDEEVLEAVSQAIKQDICNFILFGDNEKINEILTQHPNIDIGGSTVVHAQSQEDACMQAVKCVSTHQADVLMKGYVDTAVILKKVLDKDYGLRTEHVLSHVMIVQMPRFNRLLYLTDGAMIIDPTVEQMKQLTINAVKLARSIGVETPKVAVLSAIEKVNPKMESSVKAHEVQALYDNGEIPNCLLCGPLAVDLALNEEAAKIKHIDNPVAGAADILVVPYIEVGNALYKGWVFGCEHVKSAGVVLGAKAPIVLTSRSDSHESKLYSIALSILRSDFIG